MNEEITLRSVHHQEHREWLSQLDFYSEQILIFERELQQVVQEHPALLSIIEHVDEYREILDRKKIHIEDFRQRIQEHEQQLSENLPLPVSELDQAHVALREEYQEFIKDMEAFKRNFRRFVAYND